MIPCYIDWLVRKPDHYVDQHHKTGLKVLFCSRVSITQGNQAIRSIHIEVSRIIFPTKADSDAITGNLLEILKFLSHI